MTGQCKICGAKNTLVHDMRNPYSAQRRQPESMCFECWRASSWKEMKKWYLSGLVALFLGLLPLLTATIWLVYALWWKHRPHWGDSKGFYLFLYIPAMISVGAVPQVICQLWLMSRYGPQLELMSCRLRPLVELLPLAIWGATVVLALFAFAYLWDGNVVVKW